MFYFNQEISLQAWHLVYGAYLLWIAGLLAFSLLFSSSDPTEVLGQLRKSLLGKTCMIWIAFSLLAVTFAWPMFIAAPLFIGRFGAPMEAGFIMAAFAMFSLFLIANLMTDRVRTHVHNH